MRHPCSHLTDRGHSFLEPLTFRFDSNLREILKCDDKTDHLLDLICEWTDGQSEPDSGGHNGSLEPNNLAVAGAGFQESPVMVLERDHVVEIGAGRCLVVRHTQHSGTSRVEVEDPAVEIEGDDSGAD